MAAAADENSQGADRRSRVEEEQGRQTSQEQTKGSKATRGMPEDDDERTQGLGDDAGMREGSGWEWEGT